MHQLRVFLLPSSISFKLPPFNYGGNLNEISKLFLVIGTMKKTVFYLIICSFTHYVGVFGTRPYLILLAASLGASDLQVGLIASLYSMGQAAIALLVGKMIDGISPRFTLTTGSVILLIAVFLLTQASTLWLVALCSLLIGLSHVLVLITLEYTVTGLPQKSRDNSVGMYTFANSAGSFVGPAFGGYMYEWLGSNHSFWGAFMFGVLSLALSFVVPNIKAKGEKTNNYSIRHLIQDKKVLNLVIISGIILFTTEVIITYFPLYGQQIGLRSNKIGIVLGCSGMSQMLIRPFLGIASRRIPRRRLLFTCLLGGGTGIFLYGIFNQYMLLIIIAICTGACLGLINPLMMITTVDAVPSDKRSETLSLRIMGNCIGQTTSPIIFGLVSSLAGLSPVFWISGIGMIICSAMIRNTVSE